MSKSVLIEYGRDVDGYGKGERFAIASAAKAKELHPNARIVSHEDGSDYEETRPRAEVKADADKPAKGAEVKG